jgi:hypothetical protein
MPAFSGKTLWFSALALWLTATPAGGRQADGAAAVAPTPPPAVEEPHAAPADDRKPGNAE